MDQHPPTIILLSLPTTILLGLDTLALTPSPHFAGFSHVPHGWHFIYAGSTASLSTRTGYWIHIPDPQASTSDYLQVFQWDAESETLEPVASSSAVAEWRQRLTSNKTLQKGLLPYHIDPATAVPTNSTSAPLDPASSDAPTALPAPAEFSLLTPHVTPALLTRLIGSASGGSWLISTTSSAPEDRDEIPGLSADQRNFGGGESSNVAGEERELRFLGIDLKRTWREGAVGEERTKGARDRSWALGQVVESASMSGDQGSDGTGNGREWGDDVLGEMEVCFLMVLLLANWSCLQEWRRVLELVLTSREAVEEQPEFFEEFLRVLKAQLERCGDVEGGLFDVKGEEAGWLKGILRSFRRALDEMDRWSVKGVSVEYRALERWTNEEWGWELDDSFVRRGMVELEDGERIEIEVNDMEAEDERGEYAPLVVELPDGQFSS